MRLSLKKAAQTSPTPLSSTGNPGERSGGICGAPIHKPTSTKAAALGFVIPDRSVNAGSDGFFFQFSHTPSSARSLQTLELFRDLYGRIKPPQYLFVRHGPSRFMPVVQEIPLQKHDQEKKHKAQHSRGQNQGKEVIRL